MLLRMEAKLAGFCQPSGIQAMLEQRGAEGTYPYRAQIYTIRIFRISKRRA